jgi:hypothetical protein
MSYITYMVVVMQLIDTTKREKNNVKGLSVGDAS